MNVETSKEIARKEIKADETIPSTPAITDFNRGGYSNETRSPIEEARKLKAEIEKINAETKELLAKKELMMAQEMLGGRSEAGIFIPKRELTNVEYASLVRQGKINPLMING